MNPEPQDNPLQNQPRGHEDIGKKRFADFDLGGKVCLVTGAAQGLGLAMAEALVEAGCNGMWKTMCPNASGEYQECFQCIV